MSVPGQRRSSSFGKRRRSHQALSKPNVKVCEKCGEAVLPHRVCQNCGTYKGRQILNTSKKIQKTIKK